MKKNKQKTPTAEEMTPAAEEAIAQAVAEEAVAEAVAEETTAEVEGDEKTAEKASKEPAPAGDLSGAAAFLATLPEREREALIGALAHLLESERLQKAAAARAEEDAAIAQMEGSPVFAGISARKDAIRALSGAVAWLSSLPLYERLAAAYYIDRGMRYGEPTREDLLEAALADKALGRELARRTGEENARTAAAMPPVRKRRGPSATPASVKEAPRTIAQATDEAKKFLRFYK